MSGAFAWSRLTGTEQQATRGGTWFLIFFVATLATAWMAGSPVLAQTQPQASDMVDEKTYAFNLDADDLSRELVRFSELTGQQLIYDSPLTRGQRGQAVRGQFSAMEGLFALLQGTGLSAHVFNGGISLNAMSASDNRQIPAAATATPPATPEKILTLGVLSIQSKSIGLDDASIRAYGGYVAVQVKNALLMHKTLGDAQFDILAKLWMDPRGRIVRLELPAGADDQNIDKDVASMLEGMSFNPPPENMPAFRIRIQSDER